MCPYPFFLNTSQLMQLCIFVLASPCLTPPHQVPSISQQRDSSDMYAGHFLRAASLHFLTSQQRICPVKDFSVNREATNCKPSAIVVSSCAAFASSCIVAVCSS